MVWVLIFLFFYFWHICPSEPSVTRLTIFLQSQRRNKKNTNISGNHFKHCRTKTQTKQQRPRRTTGGSLICILLGMCIRGLDSRCLKNITAPTVGSIVRALISALIKLLACFWWVLFVIFFNRFRSAWRWSYWIHCELTCPFGCIILCLFQRCNYFCPGLFHVFISLK